MIFKMPNNKQKLQAIANQHIDLTDKKAVANWCKLLDCNQGQLRAGVAAVGTSAEKVKEYLNW